MSNPLGIVSDPPKQFEVLRELEHAHRSMNDRLNLVPIAVSADKNLIPTESGSILFVDTKSAVTIKLPKPSPGLNFIIKDVIGLAATNNITIRSFQSEEIDGTIGSNTISTNYASRYLVSDGTDWFLL